MPFVTLTVRMLRVEAWIARHAGHDVGEKPALHLHAAADGRDHVMVCFKEKLWENWANW